MVQRNNALYDSIYGKMPEKIQDALDSGCDPYALGSLERPAIYEILSLSSSYKSKLDYIRPLLQAGNDFDLIREKTKLIQDKYFFDQKVITLGKENYRDGDKECAAFLLANLIVHDLEKGRGYTLPIDNTLGGIGLAFRTPGDIGEETRAKTASAITRNQHALVDYIATSNDSVVAFLRSCADYPDADLWMKKRLPVDPDQYSRPTQKFIDAVHNQVGTSRDLIDHWDNKEMGLIAAIDHDIISREIGKMCTSWKPPMP